MKIIYIFLILCVFLQGCSTVSSYSSEEENKKTEIISFATWNAQTFFDSEIEGTEYDDYQNLAKWSKDKYITRLGRLCEVMKLLNADIIAIEEIENTAVVQDIANQLAGNSWDRAKNWNYACFAKDTGTAIGCAVFSRYELKNLQLHSMCIKTQSEVQPSVRPLIQVTADVNGRDLVIMVNHWKSKSGGEVNSAIWRDWQESVLSNTVNQIKKGNNKAAVVICGDFNRDALEFTGDYPNVELRGYDSIEKVYSPWFNSNGELTGETGSYYYNGQWERIDHIFTAGNLKLTAFGPKTDGLWCGAGAVPNSYKIYSGEGYSDHLPIMCAITLF